MPQNTLYADPPTIDVPTLCAEVRELRGLVDVLVNIDQPEFRELLGCGLADLRERHSLEASRQSRVLLEISRMLAVIIAEQDRAAAEQAAHGARQEHLADSVAEIAAQLDRAELIAGAR